MKRKSVVTTTRVIVQVKPKHIKRGIPKAASNCPVAHAIDEATPDWCGFVYMEPDSIELVRGDSIYAQQMPRSVERFVRAFDAGKPVKPFAFYLEVPLDS